MKTQESRLKANRAWKDKNREKLRAYGVEYNKKRDRQKKLEQNRASARRHGWYGKKYKDPIKEKSRSRVRNAVFRGKLKKLPCEVCGETNSQGHHKDYSKPLDVTWLCAKHHSEAHNDK